MEGIHSGHRDRMKKRFLLGGGEDMEPHELLELLLYYSVPRRDTNELAHRLVERFGGVWGVFEASAEELISVDGMTEHTVSLVKLMLTLCRRYYQDEAATREVGDTEPINRLGAMMAAKCIGLTTENTFLICLDNRMKVISVNKIGEGTPDSTAIVCRRIAELAIRRNAASVVLAHNHPKGFALPSRADVETTVSLCRALAAISIKLLDHIIVAGDDFISLAQSGVISPSAERMQMFRAADDRDGSEGYAGEAASQDGGD